MEAHSTGQRTTESSWAKWLILLVRVGLFAAAIATLKRQLTGISFSDLTADLHTFGFSRIGLAVVITAASYLTMCAFEILGLRYLKHGPASTIPAAFAVVTSFVANAFSLSVGVAILTGSAIRARAYSQFGFGKADVIRLTSFVTITANIGLLLVGAVVFSIAPDLTRIGSLEFKNFHPGLLLAIPVAAYVLWFVFRPGEEYGRGRFSFKAPNRIVGVLQLLLSSADWILAGSVLFVLLPDSIHVSYLRFIPIFIVAQTLATLSHVPGGVGVLEALVLSLLAGSNTEKAPLLVSLLIYRLLYYFVPLVIALVIALLHESGRGRRDRLREEQPQTIPGIAA